jgi:ATP-binding cassette, subfamily B, bacterial
MNYKLNKPKEQGKRGAEISSLKRLLPYMSGEKKYLLAALLAIIVNSGMTLLAPAIIAHTIDTYIKAKDYHGIFIYSMILAGVYIIGLCASYIQTRTMGGVGRRVLFNLRNAIFSKLQELPIAFFNQNKAGDLISRINNDTDKLNQFFSQALMQFVGNIFIIIGAGVSIVVFNIRLGLASLVPALGVLIITRVLSSWVKRKNAASLKTLGGMSAEIQESLENFKVIVAFDRIDYFRSKFKTANEENYKAAVGAGLASNIFVPIYGLSSNLAQLIVLSYGIYLISVNELTIGFLIGFFIYVNNFYNPLRQLASVWSSFQLALASFDRIFEVMSLKSDMPVIDSEEREEQEYLLDFDKVSFSYPDGEDVLKNISFSLQKGKTYALVGPTGGGKTTTAYLMARLYDPSRGIILLDGKDIRSYDPAERAEKIGYILQDPFLFTGTVRENILYGCESYLGCSDSQLIEALESSKLVKLLSRFEKGLDTIVIAGGDSISLGQKQLIAFMRAALRKPELLILDEATANIDTVTEQLLQEMLIKLPKNTTKVIIAHRLNTIETADEIFFVNAGEIVHAGSFASALKMLMHSEKKS